MKVSDVAYTGKACQPKAVVTYKGETLTENTDYTVAYSNNLKVGQGSVTVTGKGRYTGTASAVFQIVPAVSRITKAVNKGQRKLVIKLKKAKGAKGYEISYATNKKFRSAKKVKTRKLTVTLGRLKKNKTYYVRVRAYAKAGKKTYYSSYSKVVKRKVKK